VSTGSTKSRTSKKQSVANEAAKGKSRNKSTPEPARVQEIPYRVWVISSIVIVSIALFLRLYNLTLVPLHHDEGVNGNFLVRLVREGFYHYDPENYHGPSLYYFTAVIGWVIRFLFGVDAQNKYGLNTVTIRLVTALFGIATILLVLSLRKRLGTIGSLAAAALLAISPGAVYLSRYFIHETLFVFFAVGIVVASLRYFEDGHPIYLILAAASTALLFATKETFIINAPVLLLALISTQLYLWIRRNLSSKERNRLKYNQAEAQTFSERAQTTIVRLGGSRWIVMWGFVAAVVFVTVSVLFYSSFFTNYPKGVYDSLRTFEVWTKTGQVNHVHPIWKYVEWLIYEESPVLVLGALGALISLWQGRNTFAIFASFWAFGTLAGYSLVPYKTPWIALNFVVPLAIVSGCAVQAIYEQPWGQIRGVVVVMLLAVVISGYQTFDLNFVNYDNDDSYYVYVYAHTRRETLNLVEELNRIAKATGQGSQLGITIVSPDYWPLPWYLRDYGRVGYFARMAASNEPVIIASEAQKDEMQTNFGGRYQPVDSRLNAAGGYSLRPGVDLLIYVRNDVVPASR
jgi:uncharacterized protein (TIGR03663 family)